jgi:hypothetical protein
MLSLRSKWSGKVLSRNLGGFHTSTSMLEAKKLTVREAIREAIADEIVRDEKVFLMGEVCVDSVLSLTSRKSHNIKVHTKFPKVYTTSLELVV